jgi:ParB family transcriptional regulator, chromosome partitioning protein
MIKNLMFNGEVVKLRIDLLQSGKHRVGVEMRQKTLQDLADSSEAHDVVHPIVVHPIVVRPLAVPAGGEPQRYEIILGERRWREAQLAGLSEIPAIISSIPDKADFAKGLINNGKKQTLLEDERLLEGLISEFDLTHEEAANDQEI